jgi:hypothetical protein
MKGQTSHNESNYWQQLGNFVKKNARPDYLARGPDNPPPLKSSQKLAVAH